MEKRVGKRQLPNDLLSIIGQKYSNNIMQIRLKKINRKLNRLIQIFQLEDKYMFHLTELELVNFPYLKSLKYAPHIGHFLIFRHQKLENLIELECNELMTDEDIKDRIGLKKLKCNEKITNNGIEGLVNLTYLNLNYFVLDGNYRTDYQILIDEIKKLTQGKINIGDIYLRANKYIDDKAIKNLINLKYLECSDLITDEGIKDLVNLETLKMDNFSNDIISGEGLEKLTKLKFLECNNQITDKHIQNLINLEYLSCSLLLTDKSIEKLINLKILMIHSRFTLITKDCLKKLVNLEILYCCLSHIDGETVKELVKLRYLFIISYDDKIQGIENSLPTGCKLYYI